MEDTVIQGRVNGRGASLVLDSGTHITIVPEEMVKRIRGWMNGLKLESFSS